MRELARTPSLETGCKRFIIRWLCLGLVR
jgi:hypothetical protein